MYFNSHAGPSPPLRLGPFSHVANPRSVAQKANKMKEAILNAVEIPIFAMWKDESMAYPNRAALRLMGSTDMDPTSDEAYDPLSRFVAYTEDFSRELTRDERPIVRLCRTRKSFKGQRVGFIDPGGKRLVFDVSGETVCDNETGEFIVAMTTMKDVTEYTEKLKTQSEQNEQQFEMICDTMPQLLWTTRPDGSHGR